MCGRLASDRAILSMTFPNPKGNDMSLAANTPADRQVLDGIMRALNELSTPEFREAVKASKFQGTASLIVSAHNQLDTVRRLIQRDFKYE